MSDENENRARRALSALDEMRMDELAELTDHERWRLAQLCDHWRGLAAADLAEEPEGPAP